MMEANWIVYDSSGEIIRFGTVPRETMLESVSRAGGTLLWLGNVTSINPSRQKIVDGSIVDKEADEIVSESIVAPPLSL